MRNLLDLTRIEFSFDLSMDLLDKYFNGGRENRGEAYAEIGAYFAKLDFEHPMYSVYMSNNLYSYNDIVNLINDFFDSILWAENCMSECHVSLVNEQIVDVLKVRKITKSLKRDDEIDLSFLYGKQNTLEDRINYCKQKIYFHNQKAQQYKTIIEDLTK